MRIRFTLLADGTSDRILIPLARWTFYQHLSPDSPVEGAFADVRALPQPPGSLAGRIARAVDLYPCDVLLVHRDAETPDPHQRYEEIHRAFERTGLAPTQRYLCVVPVRMTEAWFSFDENAVRRAAGNPNGRTRLNLPRVRDCEGLADPKSVLLDGLSRASELSGRRARSFSAERARGRLAELIDDFSPLRELCAFRRFESDVQTILDQLTSSAR